MVYYLFFVAIADLGLGFGLAAFLGRRYRALAAARDWARLSATGAPQGASAADDAPPDAAAQEELPPKSPFRQAVETLHQQVDRYGQQLSEADVQLRQLAAAPDISGIEACLSRLDTLSREFLDERDNNQHQLAGLLQDSPAGEQTRHDLQLASQLQDVEIKRTRQDIVNFDYDGDPGRSCLRMVEQTNRLISAGDHLRDTLHSTLADVAREEDYPPRRDAAEPADALTGCVSRAAAEAGLAALCRQDPAERHFCAAMFDLDRFSQVNEQFGYRAGNATLAAVGRLLQADCPAQTAVSRYAGQRFLLVFPATGLHDAAGTVERIRQIVQNVCFEYHDSDIRITISCAVAEATADDSVASLLERVEAALGESKRYGRNRTFACEGRFPTPVVPPDLDIPERRISL